MNITHHFSNGIYTKQTDFLAGEEATMHEHTHSHQSVLCKGWVRLAIGDQAQEIRGPKVLEILSGLPHSVKALTDATWLCTHRTDETDPEKIDENLTT